MSHAVINGDKVVPPCTVSRASAQSEQRGGGRGELEGAEGALVLGYGHGVRGPTVAVRTHAQIAPPCTASRASAQSEERGGRPCKSEGGRRAGRGRARCARRQRSYSTERRGSGRCAWSEGRTFSETRCVGMFWLPSLGGCGGQRAYVVLRAQLHVKTWATREPGGLGRRPTTRTRRRTPEDHATLPRRSARAQTVLPRRGRLVWRSARFNQKCTTR